MPHLYYCTIALHRALITAIINMLTHLLFEELETVGAQHLHKVVIKILFAVPRPSRDRLVRFKIVQHIYLLSACLHGDTSTSLGKYFMLTHSRIYYKSTILKLSVFQDI